MTITEIDVIDHMETYQTTAEVIFPVFMAEDLQIHVAKVGGGTPDRLYTGHWIVQVHQCGELLWSTEEMHTGTPSTHYRAAVDCMQTLAQRDEREPETLAHVINELDDWAAMADV